MATTLTAIVGAVALWAQHRFFIAMNNPIVQKLELIPYADYYRGCFKLYKYWRKYRIVNKLPLIMDDTAIDSCFDEFDKYADTSFGS